MELSRYKIFLLIILFAPVLTYSQIFKDSLTFSKNNYTLNRLVSNFEKQLNTYNLQTQFKLGYDHKNFFVGINERFLSTIVRSSNINIKDEQYLSVLGEYYVSPFLSTGLLIKSNNYNDDRQLDINQSSIMHSSLFAKIYPLTPLSLTAYGGLSKNKQIGTLDEGLVYGGEANLDNLYFDEFKINSSLKYHIEDIEPRKNEDKFFNANVMNSFENNLSNLITGQISEMRKDFYFDADSLINQEYNVEQNIQSRIETRYFFEDRLTFNPVRSNLAFLANGRLSWRDIDRNTRYIPTDDITVSTFDTRISEFRLDLNSTVSYTEGPFRGLFDIVYSEREEKHNAKFIEGASDIIFDERQELEGRKNNTSRLTILTASGTLALSETDNLTFSLFHRKLKYDTPSDQNFDDRDELLSILRLYYVKGITPFFDLFFNLEGSLNKTVYIFSQRSSNNNTRRVIKFSGGGDYKIGILRSRNEAIVSANYTVYDFEDLNPNFSSFSFRQLYLKDSTQVKLGKNISFDLTAYLKLSEQGDFNWTDFSGRPFRFLEEIFFEPKLVYQFGKLRLASGIRYFSLLTFIFDNNNVKIMDTKYTSTAPLAEIIYIASSYLRLRVTGWFEFINNESDQKRELTNLFINLNWYF
jgi:hypothetical protein